MAQAFHALVSGKVQGVWFRGSAADKAAELGIYGWARNLPDGRVEVLAAGDPEDLEAFREWLAVGPPAARVDDVQVESTSPGDVPAGFSIE